MPHLSDPTTEIFNPLAEELHSKHEVEEELKLIDESKSMGPDDMHPCLLKFCARLLAAPLTDIFSRSHEEDRVSEYFKLGNIVAFFKKNYKVTPSNYRLISLTSIICKVFHRAILLHLTRHNIISIMQLL